MKKNQNSFLVQPGKGYKEGATYVYDFEGTAVTSLLENQSQSTATLKAGVELTVKPNCLKQLRIKNAQLNGAVCINKNE